MQAFLDRHFIAYKDFIFDQAGIRFGDAKRQQLETKIRKAMMRSGCESFDDFYEILKKEPAAYQLFINIITTNTTEFFRERDHFEYLEKNMQMMFRANPNIMQTKELRLWCAASSTGQEPVSIAIQLKECLPRDVRINILATDINSEVLSKAMIGQYKKSDSSGIPLEYRKYFREIDEENIQVKDEILSVIRYRKFNLMNEFSFKKKFDMIFCRNVMIYFPTTVQRVLVNKFYDCLMPGGFLFVGHTESLLNKKNSFTSMAPSVYMK